MLIIYKITNTVNGMPYIGQTKKSLEKRWKEHVNWSNTSKRKYLPFYCAIRKYGEDKFIQEEICSGIETRREADQLETFWIKELNSLFPNGYNMTPGGTGNPRKYGHKLSEETKKKISVAHKGRKRKPYKRSPFSDQHQANISKGLKAFYRTRPGKGGAKKQEYCKKGLHRLEAANVYFYRGKRRCLVCLKEQRKDYIRGNKEFKSCCVNGHEFDVVGFYTSKNGSRHCKACASARSKARNERLRLEQNRAPSRESVIERETQASELASKLRALFLDLQNRAQG